MDQRSAISTPRTIGNYILEVELGRGATSQVWRGRHRFLREREVAVKILLSQDEDSITRFGREAEITAKLRHPNIVAVYDHGQAGNFMYTVMELVPGGSLRQYLAKHPQLPLKEAFTIFRQVGTALDVAHSKGIVHRDVAPGNVLLETVERRALLTDFGIARVAQQSHTTTHVIMGTPGFFSPEHAQSATAVTALSDLYGLGVIFYYMLAGALPWAAAPAHPEYRFGNVLPLATHNLDLPPDLDKIFQTLLAVDQKKRYPTSAAATEAIERALQRAGVALGPTLSPSTDGTLVRAINTASTYQSVGIIESEVEAMLGPDLVREPIEKAHARAEQLRDPLVLAKLLDGWSASGSYWEFRRANLGRIVNLRSVSSRNVYFYHLNVLLETRTAAATIEEPDKEAADFKVQRQVDRWAVPLPPPTAFEDDPGRSEIIPGSERVIQCPRCSGEGHAICTECKGTRRVLRRIAVSSEPVTDVSHQQTTVVRVQPNDASSSPTEFKQTLVPCPTCNGAGSLPCEQCDSVGRLVQRRVFSWHRVAHEGSAHDDFPNLDEDALRRKVEMVPVYDERSERLKREWQNVPALKTLLSRIEGDLNQDTRVIMAQVLIQMIPYTDVAFDMGRSEVAIEQETTRPADDRLHQVQLLGFENKLEILSGAHDHLLRVLVWSLGILLVVVLILLGYILVTR
ncbi:MAG: protein kinase [Herpetosiphon sp.]